MSGFSKECVYCHKDIRLSNDTGKWLPYNTNGSFYECKRIEQPQPPKQQQQQQSTLTLESIDKRLKRIELTLFGKEE